MNKPLPLLNENDKKYSKYFINHYLFTFYFRIRGLLHHL